MNDSFEKQPFDLSQIGEADRINLCSTFLKAIMRYYADPTNQRRFEEWKRTRTTPETHTSAITD
jgi:hypothetical protein